MRRLTAARRSKRIRTVPTPTEILANRSKDRASFGRRLQCYVGTGFNSLPTFGDRKEINTVITLHDGETNMLAGLIRNDETKQLDGLPGLSDMPLVGRLFGHTTTNREQTDVILGNAHPARHPRARPHGGRSAAVPRRGTRLDGADHRAAVVVPPPPKPPGEKLRIRWRPRSPAADADLRHPRDFRTEPLQPFDEPSVAALDGLERRQAALTVSRQRRRDQRHPRSRDRGCRADGRAAAADPVTMMRCGSQKNRSPLIPLNCSSANSRSS